MAVLKRLAIVGTAVTFVALTSACSSSSKTTAASGHADSTASSPASKGATPSATRSTAAKSGAGGGGKTVDVNVCSLLTAAKASALRGTHYLRADSKMIASGQDQCTYDAPDNGFDLTVIVYQPTSGVTFSMLKSVLADSGNVTTVNGVGDKAIVGAIELDAQAGERVVSVEGAGGTLTGDYTKAVAIAKAVIGALG